MDYNKEGQIRKKTKKKNRKSVICETGALNVADKTGAMK